MTAPQMTGLTGAREFPTPSIERVIATFVAGLDGYKMSDGEPLTATANVTVEQAISDSRLPFLGVVGLTEAVTPFGSDEDALQLTLSAIFKVTASKANEGTAHVHRALDDLHEAVDRIRGLPVDIDGNVYPLQDGTPRRYQRGELVELATRGGPYITAAQTIDQPGGPYGVIRLSFAVGFFLPHASLPSTRVRQFVIGVRAISPYHITEPTSIDGAGIYDPATRAWAQDTTPAPSLAPATPGDPPFLGGTNDGGTLAIVDPARWQIATLALPYSASVAALATSQLTAFAVYQDTHPEPVTTAATWASSNAAVATVSSTGLVTGVASGSATITATFGSYTSNAVAITVP